MNSYSFLQPQRCKTFEMFALKVALLLVCAAAVQGIEQASCDYSNSEYMTKKSNEHFSKAMAGQEGKWDSSEPMYVEKIEDDSDSLAYTLTDVTLSGISGGSTTSLSLDEQTSQFTWTIAVPELVTKYKFVFKGAFMGIDLDGEGEGTDVRTNYNIIMNGTFSSYTDDENKNHVSMEDVLVDFELLGTVTYTLNGLSDETNKAINDVSTSVEIVIDRPMLKDMMKNTFLKNINAFLKIYSMEELFCN